MSARPFRISIDQHSAELAYCDCRSWPLGSDQYAAACKMAARARVQHLEFYADGRLRKYEDLRARAKGAGS